MPLLTAVIDEPSTPPANAGAGARPPGGRVVALVAANALQVGLTWWILRETASGARRRATTVADSSRDWGGALRVVALVLANGVQVAVTWWVYHRHAAARGRPQLGADPS